MLTGGRHFTVDRPEEMSMSKERLRCALAGKGLVCVFVV